MSTSISGAKNVLVINAQGSPARTPFGSEKGENGSFLASLAVDTKAKDELHTRRSARAVSTPAPLCCNVGGVLEQDQELCLPLLPTLFPACLVNFPDSFSYCIHLLYSPQAPWVSSDLLLTPHCDVPVTDCGPSGRGCHSHLCVLSTQCSI